VFSRKTPTCPALDGEKQSRDWRSVLKYNNARKERTLKRARGTSGDGGGEGPRRETKGKGISFRVAE